MKKILPIGRTKWTALFDDRSYVFMTTISMGEAGGTLHPLAGAPILASPVATGEVASKRADGGWSIHSPAFISAPNQTNLSNILYRSSNPFTHTEELLPHLRIGKPQDTELPRLHIRRPFHVIGPAILFKMLTAINLNHQPETM